MNRHIDVRFFEVPWAHDSTFRAPMARRRKSGTAVTEESFLLTYFSATDSDG